MNDIKIGDIVRVVSGGTDCGEAKVKELDETGIWVEYDDNLRIKFTNKDMNVMLIKRESE